MIAAHPGAIWFETRGVAALLTMRICRPHPEERALARVSKDEATAPDSFSIPVLREKHAQ